jgi:signal transduction histidine kinase
MERGRLVRLAVAVGVLLVGVTAGLETAALGASASSFSRFGSSIAATGLGVLAGWCLLLGGTLTWLAPGRGTRGAVLAGIGLCWFVADWASPAAPSLIFTLGLTLGHAWPALLLHAIVAWTPAGRIIDQRRALRTIAYGTNLGLLGLVPALAFDPVRGECTRCPPNLVSVASDPAFALSVTRLGFIAETAWIVAAITLVCLGLGQATRTERRLMAGITLPALVVLAAVAVDAVYSIPRGSLSNDPVDVAIWSVQGIGLLGVAAGVGATWLRRRQTRHRVAELALELAATPPTGELARALGRALDDSTLELRYPLEDGRLIDPSGVPVEPPHGDDVTTTVVQRAGTPIAILVHRVELAADTGRIGEAVAAARLALENERLHAQGRWRLRELRDSRAQIVAASDAERRRLEQDLHDGSQQRILALAIDMATARQRASHDSSETPSTADGAALEQEVRAALAELRELAHGIFPRSLADDGLAAAIEELAETASIPIELVALPVERFDPGIEAAAYLVIARAIRQHEVRRASVDVRTADERLLVEVRLDAPDELDPAMLVDLEDRCGALEGTVTYETGPDGRLELRAEIPCVL